MILCDVDPVAGAVEDVVPVVPIGLFRGVGDLRIDVAGIAQGCESGQAEIFWLADLAEQDLPEETHFFEVSDLAVQRLPGLRCDEPQGPSEADEHVDGVRLVEVGEGRSVGST